MQRRRKTKDRHQLIAVQARIEPELIDRLDEECRAMGRCPRAVMIRIALLERYRATAKQVEVQS